MESVALTGSKFLGLSARQIPICRADRGFFQNVADVSIAYQIFGIRVFFLLRGVPFFLAFPGEFGRVASEQLYCCSSLYLS